jgi:hypothetical protein
MEDVSLEVESTAVDGDGDTKGFGSTSHLSRWRIHGFIHKQLSTNYRNARSVLILRNQENHEACL